jgi:serine/threonine protein kinase
VSFWIGSDSKMRIVQPFAEQGDLIAQMHRLQAGGKWTLHTAATYMVDAAQGLAHIHGLPTPVIHRDVKMDNMLVTGEQVARLADFGWAHGVAPGASAIGEAGTPMTMAPEMLRDSVATTASDVWSLGVVCFQLLAGDHTLSPFWDGHEPLRTMAQLQRLVETRDVNWALVAGFTVPGDLRALITDMLRRNPADRPTAAQVVTRLHRALDGIPAPLGYEHRMIQQSPLAAALARFHTVRRCAVR